MLKGLVGKTVLCVDLSKDRDGAIKPGIIIGEMIKETGKRKFDILVDNEIRVYTPEFVHEAEDTALAFYDKAKPLSDKIKLVNEQRARDIDALWAEMGTVVEFPEIGEIITAKVNAALS